MSKQVIERDPAYETWEAEYAALVLREAEVLHLLDTHGPFNADAAFQELMAQGFNEEYCQDATENALEEHKAAKVRMNDEQRRIRARLQLIRPYVNKERHAANLQESRSKRTNDYHPQLFERLDRIAIALEAIASGLGCYSSKAKPKRRKVSYP